MRYLIKWIIFVVSILLAAKLITGVEILGVWAAIWLSIFIGFVNIFIRPILVIITLPITIITLGLFTFVINALLILLSSSVIEGFEVVGFLPALLFSILLSVISYILNSIFIEN